MHLLFKPNQEIKPTELTNKLLSFFNEFKVSVLCSTPKNQYISTVTYGNIINNDEISFSFDIFYKDDGGIVDFVVLNLWTFRYFNSEERIGIFKELFESFNDLSNAWLVVDLINNKLNENESNLFPILEDSLLGHKEVSKQTDSSTYQKILNINLCPTVKARTESIQLLSELVSSEKHLLIKSYLTYELLNVAKESDYPSTCIKSICDTSNLNTSNDIDLFILLYLAMQDSLDPIKNIECEKVLAEASKRQNKPPFQYLTVSVILLIQKRYVEFFQICSEGYKKYELFELWDLLEKNKSRLNVFKQIKVSILTQGWGVGLSIFKLFIPLALFFNLPLISNISSYALFILPIQLSSKTLSYIVDEDTVFGYAAFMFISLCMLAIVFVIIKASISRTYYQNFSLAEKKMGILFKVGTVIVCVILACNMCPSMFLSSASLSYIQTDRISGNAYVADINEISKFQLNIIEPQVGEGACPFITESATDCSFKYEVLITEKDARTRQFLDDHICSNDLCMQRFIFKNADATKNFIQIMKANNIQIETNYDQSTLEKYQMPESFKTILREFIN